jgi:hypothetical protein
MSLQCSCNQNRPFAWTATFELCRSHVRSISRYYRKVMLRPLPLCTYLRQPRVANCKHKPASKPVPPAQRSKGTVALKLRPTAKHSSPSGSLQTTAGEMQERPPQSHRSPGPGKYISARPRFLNLRLRLFEKKRKEKEFRSRTQMPSWQLRSGGSLRREPHCFSTLLGLQLGCYCAQIRR